MRHGSGSITVVCSRQIFLLVTLVVGCATLTQKAPSIARIRASRTSIQTVNDTNGSLMKYMQLPASQYSCVPMPLNSSLDRVIGTADQFKLRVPPIKLKSPGVPEVEVRPLMMARVKVESDRVLISSNSCQILGSKLIDDMNINDFFEFNVQICLTWELGDKTSYGVGANDDTSSPSITAKSKIEIDLNPPGIFTIVPRKILELVGNQAIGITLGSLQKNFMTSLGDDFERWSVDAEYRAQRQKLELDMENEDVGVLKANTDETLMAYLKPQVRP